MSAGSVAMPKKTKNMSAKKSRGGREYALCGVGDLAGDGDVDEEQDE